MYILEVNDFVIENDIISIVLAKKLKMFMLSKPQLTRLRINSIGRLAIAFSQNIPIAEPRYEEKKFHT